MTDEIGTSSFGLVAHKNITQELYENLLADQKKLRALEAAGVDNWDGYEYALELLEEE